MKTRKIEDEWGGMLGHLGWKSWVQKRLVGRKVYQF